MKPVIIVGFGPVGAILSLLLARRGIPVIVVEASASYPDEPRALGFFGPSHFVLQEAGVYEEAKAEGLPSAGLCYRKRATDDGAGGLGWGDIIVSAPLAPPVEDGEYRIGSYLLLLPQAQLVRIVARKIQDFEASGLAKVHLGHRFVSSEEVPDGVAVTVEGQDGKLMVLHGSYTVGADGSQSAVRRSLGLKLCGYSWPARLISTDVSWTVPEVPEIPSCLVVDQEYWAAITPLEPINPGLPGLWRFSMAVSDPEIPAERLHNISFVENLVKKHITGPYGRSFEVVRFRPYKMHQLLCPVMRKGRAFLAGDSAHINNPIGGLGLNTGILDADALAQTFDLVLNQAQSEALFDQYSHERRRVFQLYVNPISAANKQRLHDSNPNTAAQDDWFFAAMGGNDPERSAAHHRILMDNWRTDMSRFLSTK